MSTTIPQCADMTGNRDSAVRCRRRVTMIDRKGYVYCDQCGVRRRDAGVPARVLRGWEIELIMAGKPVPSYQPISRAEATRRGKDVTP